MKPEAELERYFTTRLQPALEPLEQYRIEQVQKLKNTLYWIIPCLLLIIPGFVSGEPVLVFLSGIPLLITMGLAFRTLSAMMDRLTRQFKNQVMPELLAFLFERFEYIPRQKIAGSVLEKSLLLPYPVRTIEGEDFMRFKLGETMIMFCETKASNTENARFTGIFISASFNKYFKSATILLPSRFSYFFQKTTQQLVSGFQIVKLEDVAFSRKFTVISTDQVEARYILTPGFMQRLLDYRKKIRKAASFSFVDNHLYCAIPNYKNLFEPALFEPFDLDFIKRTCEPLRLYTGLVDDLHLNIRIWSKP
jgi:hypothetical protein